MIAAEAERVDGPDGGYDDGRTGDSPGT